MPPSYKLIAASTSSDFYDKHLMNNVKIIDASAAGTVDFEFVIDERYANMNGVMHGGAAGVIFDMCTTTALGPLAKPGFWEYALLSVVILVYGFRSADKKKFPGRSDADVKYQLFKSYPNWFVLSLLCFISHIYTRSDVGFS